MIKGTATSERRGLSWLMVWRNAVHTWRGRNSRRKLTAMDGCGNLVDRRQRRGNASAQLAHFPLVLIQFRITALEMVPPMLRVGFSSSVKALWTHPHR